MEDAVAMERAIELARAAAERGDEPYGSVIVVEGRIVSEGENSVATDLDPTAHAEITAIRRACRDLERTDLSGGTIYASGEPCWTCSAAIRGARLSRVVYAAPSLWDTGGDTSDFPILRAEVAGLSPPPEVVSGVLEDQARALFAELGWTESKDGRPQSE